MSKLSRESDEYGKLPDHVCPDCTVLRFEGEPTCSVCGRERPDEGWKPLEQVYDAFLGRVVDGRYLVAKKEGTGASAAVYRGKRLSDNRTVALKISRVAGKGQKVEDYVRERMSREVRAVGMLDNPHIVPIYEFVELDSGPSVIVMDFVDGATTSSLVEDRGPLDVDSAVSIVHQSAECLAEAHEADLIHRDIKPENIMVERDEGAFFAYLLDFGIVRHQEKTSGLTQGFIGTPLFTSPEQACMDEIDARTDIYSLGATLFFYLSGRAPFDREGVDDVMRAQVSEEPESLADAAEETRPPPELVDLVDQMLEKRAEDRPESMDDVAARLEWLRDEVRSRRSSGSFERANGSAPETPTGTIHGLQRTDERLEPSTDGAGGEHLGGGGDGPAERPEDLSSGDFDAVGLASETSAREEDDLVAQEDEPEGSERALEAQNSVAFLTDEQQRELERRTEAFEDDGEEGESERGIGGLLAADVEGDSDLLAADRSGRIWRVGCEDETPTRVGEHDPAPVDVALGGDRVFVGIPAGRVLESCGSGGESDRVFETPSSRPVTAIGTDGSGGRLAVGTPDGRVFAGAPGADEWSRVSGFGTVVAVDYASDGSCFALGDDEGRVRLFASDDPEDSTAAFDDVADLVDVAVSSDGQLVAVVTAERSAVVYHSHTGREVARQNDLSLDLVAIYFSSTEELCGVGEADGGIVLWDCVRNEVRSAVAQSQAPSRRR